MTIARAAMAVTTWAALTLKLAMALATALALATDAAALGVVARAADDARSQGTMKSTGSVKISSNSNQVVAQIIKSGFHFNQEAPNRIMIGDKTTHPLTKSKQALTFPALTIRLNNAVGARAVLYVCDDALTVCDIHEIELARPSK